MAALEDELVRVSSSKNTSDVVEEEDDNIRIFIHWVYLAQAEALIYKINANDSLPEFVIFIEDIPRGLIEELSHYGKAKMKKIITNAVRRIYESVDPEFFHTNGIYGKIKWRLAPAR